VTVLDTGVEYWDVKGYVGYLVGDDGSVWSNKPSFRNRTGSWVRLLARPNPRNGYPGVDLQGRTCLVHVLVLNAFVGPKPERMWARHHPDPTRSNNALSNLSWATATENICDKYGDGTMARGETNGKAKLTTESVLEIRERYARGDVTYTALAAEFGVGIATVWRVVRRITWSHIL